MSQEAREGIYAATFQGIKVYLHQLFMPPEVNKYPDLAEEIKEALFRRATVYMKVWTNFDPVEETFHADPSMQHCGKPLSDTALTAFVGRGGAEWQMYNLGVDISTPFESLATLTLDVRPSPNGGLPVVETFLTKAGRKTYADLLVWLNNVLEKVVHSDPTRGKQGFKLPDILELAQRLVRMPNANGDFDDADPYPLPPPVPPFGVDFLRTPGGSSEPSSDQMG
ncbi:hypothetical protein KC340_g12720 [Hortaea werneckii]|nr:hypothetical protein KC342_g13026 [Hortaea werneckii]KAI7073540.1 hypothetical protein KC339_g14186 [Hortaea werneckii]KAI7225065.1 hypothetical protein KC365_g10223 [Hortaea werneckii]KAI7302483.1 hypothetical protein KC340_g12720 [Hortaea werneckii]KAI7386614.1 hypothetical protein KC328_g9804 [Hortaea werneckii]